MYKVWSAFVKFIRSQTAGKQKLVDTTFIGHLYKKDDEPINNANLELLVSQEFYEAGKFKNKQPPNFSKGEEIIKVRGYCDNCLDFLRSRESHPGESSSHWLSCGSRKVTRPEDPHRLLVSLH